MFKVAFIAQEPGLAFISNESYISSTISLNCPSLVEHNISQEFVLALKGVDRLFYRKCGELYYKNAKRNQNSKNRIGKRILEYQLSDVKGTLKENV